MLGPFWIRRFHLQNCLDQPRPASRLRFQNPKILSSITNSSSETCACQHIFWNWVGLWRWTLSEQSFMMSSSNFLSLPINVRNNIYERVLAVPQPLHIFQDTGCPVESFIPGKPYQWLALLYTNRQISAEAKAALYRVNSFMFQDVDRRPSNDSPLEAFIRSIGPSNAGSLSQLCINFPVTENVHGEIKIREDSLRKLKLLQKECTNLTTLETLVFSESSKFLIEQNVNSVREIFWEINTQFRCISPLERIIVRIYTGSLSTSVREFLQGLGWAVLGGDR